ncbi:MAG: NAD-dependent epimerase/dehydratase family protein [Anaerolineales bacterium]
MNKVLITGGAGFIGAALTRQLVAQGVARPAVFDIAAPGGRLAGVLDRIEYIRGDLGNFSHVLAAVKQSRPEAIFHLGALLSTPSDDDPPSALHANILGTFHVLEAARLFDVPQVVFASSVATYGRDIQTTVIDDVTLQRPELFYGVTKVFGEHTGLFFRRKYGLDFRGVRFQSIVGPGVRTMGVDHYTSWAIEESALGRPFTIWVEPRTRIPVIYYKDAALALQKLSAAPREQIKTINYLLAGVTPVASAGELADLVRARIPGAQIAFSPNPDLQAVIDKFLRPMDERGAREEWGWQCTYDQERIVEDFLAELGRG